MNRGLRCFFTLLFVLLAAGGTYGLPADGLTSRINSSARATRPADPQTLTVPAETEAAVQLLSGIHSRVSRVDDPVQARLLEPVFVDGRVALPSGTLLDGRIVRIQSPGHLRRPAEMAFRFERILLPDGRDEPISAVLSSFDSPEPKYARVDAEGHVRGGRGLSWKGLMGGIAAVGTFASVRATVSGAAALGPILPAGGAALLGYGLLWSKGNDVHLPPETRCRIRLNHALTVRVEW